MKILFPYMARWSSAHASRFYHLLTNVAELGHCVYVIQPPSRGSLEANDIDVHFFFISKKYWIKDFQQNANK